MKFLILTALLIGFEYASAAAVPELRYDEWDGFKQQYGKIYEHETEEEFRKKIFLDNKRKIDEHNERFEKGLVSFRMGINKFADLLHTEFVQMMTGLRSSVDNKRNSSTGMIFEGASNHFIPEKVDWREKGAVTRVKDQKDCGSCWAFSATGALEGQHYLKTHKLVELSEQNLIDCSRKYGNVGCNGGLMNYAFDYVKDNGGIDTELSYSYEGFEGSCRFNKSNIGATEKNYVNLTEGDENKLKEAVATIGPISVGILATDNFISYSSGVFYDDSCSSEDVNHGVLVVGYGTDNKSGLDYWIVKNSWDDDWGEDGYIRMSRNRNNNCNIASLASYPLV